MVSELVCRRPAAQELSIFDLPESGDEQLVKQLRPGPQPVRQQLTFEEDAKCEDFAWGCKTYAHIHADAAIIAFCSKYTQCAAEDRARKALLRLTARSAFCSLLRSMPKAPAPDSLPLLWSKLANVFIRARTLCEMVVTEIKRTTELQLQRDKLELQSMSTKLAGDNDIMRRMILGKKKLIRGELRKMDLLLELLEGRKMVRLQLPR